MAKRKPKEQPQNNEIKIIEGQKYNGSVNIRLVRNGKTVKNITQHNAGHTPLFMFLVNCLNENYNSNDVPKYISLGHYNNDYTSYTPYSNIGVPKTSQFVSTTPNYQVNYQFTVPTMTLKSNSNLEINALRLYNTTNSQQINEDKIFENSQCSAEIRLDTSISISVADLQKYTLFVTWSLYITNSN